MAGKVAMGWQGEGEPLKTDIQEQQTNFDLVKNISLQPFLKRKLHTMEYKLKRSVDFNDGSLKAEPPFKNPSF